MNSSRIAGLSLAAALSIAGQAAQADTIDTVVSIVNSVSGVVNKATSKSTDDSAKKTEKKDDSSAAKTQSSTQTTTAASPATATPQPQTAESGFSVSDMGFSVAYPTGWAKSRPDANTVSFVDADSNVEFNIQNVPTTANGGKFASASELANELKAQLSQSCQGYRLIGERDCLYSGVQGREFMVEYLLNSTSFRQWFSILPRPDGRTIHQFYFFVPTTSYDKYFPQVQKFLGSWKLTGVEAPAQLRVQPPSLKTRAQTQVQAAPAAAAVTTAVATASAPPAAPQAQPMKQHDASSVELKIIKLQTENAIQAEKGKYDAKALSLQSEIIKDEGAKYMAMPCPKCGAKDGFALVNWQWQCPKCQFVAASTLDTLAPSCKTYREEIAAANLNARIAIAAAKSAGNKALAAKGYAPLWNEAEDDLPQEAPAAKPLKAAAPSAKALADDFFSAPSGGASN